MLLFKKEENAEDLKPITSPDDLKSVTVLVDSYKNIKKAVFYRNYEFTPANLLRFFTIVDLIKHKQRAADYPVKISSQVAGIQKPNDELLYIFRDKDNLSDKVTQDIFFIHDKVTGGEPLFESNREHIEKATENLKSVKEQKRARQLLSSSEFIDVYEDFWDNVIISYTRFQSDVIYNFLFNVFRKYQLY